MAIQMGSPYTFPTTQNLRGTCYPTQIW